MAMFVSNSIRLSHSFIDTFGLIKGSKHSEQGMLNDYMEYNKVPKQCDKTGVSDSHIYRHFVKLHSLYRCESFKSPKS